MGNRPYIQRQVMVLKQKVQLEGEHGERLEEKKKLLGPASAKPFAEYQEGGRQVQCRDQL